MSYKPVAIEFARYNQWQNETLISTGDELDKEALTADHGLFFGSILATLDHILMVDRFLLDFARTGAPPGAFDPTQRIETDWAGFRSARVAQDRIICDMAESERDSWFEDAISFHSDRLGRDRAVPRWFYLAQMFNHQTHHRAQVTSALHRLGVDYGNTDLPYNPHSQF